MRRLVSKTVKHELIFILNDLACKVCLLQATNKQNPKCLLQQSDHTKQDYI
uniref:Uncharacterized protein n=1 Tax=Setaria italica TaxID=4555 RepID=K3ZFQ7_SETIT